MKLNLRFSIPLRTWKLHRVVRWLTLIVVSLYGVFALWLLYDNVVRPIAVPEEIDPTQVSARQEKIDRALLDAILEQNEAKTAPVEQADVPDPFSS